ncbi:MAG: NAD(P)/FAD-dependent oxidoreductase [Caulobacter sp.]|nr:NAD(P)/FAD-dependent oxidoreductase [Caulobacter sp.]
MTAAIDSYDAIIVGAGPAGLTAATYLGRFRRSVLVIDGGPSRASWIPTSHNTPGFPAGVGGEALLARLRDQATRYGARIRAGQADHFERQADGFRLALTDGVVGAPFVLLATGVLDRKPDLAGIDAAIHRGLVRICPICDAYEAIDTRIAVLGDGDLGGREALFLRTYSDQVTLLHLGEAGGLSDPYALRAQGVEVLEVALGDLSLGEADVVLGGGARTFDHLYLAFGCELQSRLAVRWGAAHDAENNLVVDAHQQTSIDGLYAAGDVVRGLNQIAVATAEAAIAATDIHNRLRQAKAQPA